MSEYEALVEQLSAWPEFYDVFKYGLAGPPVGLLCRQGHLLCTVMLHRDHHSDPRLGVVWRRDDSPERGAQTATGATRRAEAHARALAEGDVDPADDDGWDNVSYGRVRLTCVDKANGKRCTYSGTYRQVALMKRYALAVRLGRRSIPLS